jgi:mRNA-degrading endonuclease RelE of RelBE toxin-antitoxin system
MKYNVTIRKKAFKALEKINEPYYASIKAAIYSLADNPLARTDT